MIQRLRRAIAKWWLMLISPKRITAELPCMDCGCEIIGAMYLHQDGVYYIADDDEPRCETCKDHHYLVCGNDCPIVCPHCDQHHFLGDRCGQNIIASGTMH